LALGVPLAPPSIDSVLSVRLTAYAVVAEAPAAFRSYATPIRLAPTPGVMSVSLLARPPLSGLMRKFSSFTLTTRMRSATGLKLTSPATSPQPATTPADPTRLVVPRCGSIT
jgi:hypothetical protein